MRIAQIAPLTESVPPRLYGGTERVVSYLTEALVEMGHEVTLFASGDSKTSAQLESAWPTALRFDRSLRDPIAPHMTQMESVCRAARDFDVLRTGTPAITTLHGRLDLPEVAAMYDLTQAPVVSISDAQRKPLPNANFVRTVYHGLPENLLTPQPVKPSYLAFLGRIAPEKRPDRAIAIARRAGIPLKIAAKVDRVDQEYFDTIIKPMLDGPGVEMIGEIGDAEKPAFLSGAHALLLPIDWPEPFGLVMIEAMACGTPTIAFPAGSVPEIIDDGITGFIVKDVDRAVAAIDRLGELDRGEVRRQFETRFTAGRMAEDYVQLYHRMAAGARPLLRVV
jgi:glycosyltransferase involved in cell wall biosynthesis